MRRFKGNQQVEPGLYFNLAQLSFKAIETKGILPGGETDVYRRVPVVAMLIAGPILGLAFVVFLPFVGFAMLAWVLAGRAVDLGTVAAQALGRVVRPAWGPAVAFLSPARRTKAIHGERDRWVDEVKQDLEETAREDT